MSPRSSVAFKFGAAAEALAEVADGDSVTMVTMAIFIDGSNAAASKSLGGFIYCVMFSSPMRRLIAYHTFIQFVESLTGTTGAPQVMGSALIPSISVASGA